MTRTPPFSPSPEAAPDLDAPPSEEETAAAEALRRALEDPSLPNDAADLARAAALAHAPRAIEAAEHRRLVEAALARAAPRRGRLLRVAFGAGTALALAAGVALLIGSPEREAPRSVAAAEGPSLIPARSTQPLFEEPFAASSGPARTGLGSARIDRIALARASDLRENEFARWGAR